MMRIRRRRIVNVNGNGVNGGGRLPHPVRREISMVMTILRRRINGSVRGVNGGGRLPHPVRRKEISMVMRILLWMIVNGIGVVRGVSYCGFWC